MTLKEKNELMDTMGKKVMFYIDMDGVLAKWEAGCTFERTLEPGYFYSLEVENAIKEAIRLLLDNGFNVSLLSAAYMNGIAEVDKDRWLNDNDMKDFPRLFVPCGQNKADFINANKDVLYVLLDDYNFNLKAWKETNKNGAKFMAIKFLNGINGGGTEWTGRTIYHHSDAETIANSIVDFALLA